MSCGGRCNGNCNCNKEVEDGRNTMSAEERYEICETCEWFRSAFKQCKKCKCFMPAKVLIKFATCPIRRWQ